ncbi:CARDB domain-containing protein [Natrarchaeobius oligotrophus]|nr:CARDB domain-containing protein [Natrarchaeobius chitinivorans]
MSKSAVTVGMTLILILAPLAGVVGAAPPPAQSASVSSDDLETGIEDLSVSENAPFTLRADYTSENANTVVDNQDVSVLVHDTTEVTLDANYDHLGVFSQDTVPLEYHGDESDLTDLNLIVGQVDPDEGTSVVDLLTAFGGDSLDPLNENVDFQHEDNDPDVSDGVVTYDASGDEAGQYVAILATDGLEIDGGDLTVESETTIAGLESFVVQDGPSTVDHPSAAELGDDVEFTAGPSGIDQPVQHGIVLYDEDTFLDESTLIEIEEEISADISTDNVTIHSDIGDLNGEFSVEDELELFGFSGGPGSETGMVSILDVVAATSDQTGFDEDQVEAGSTVLDASATALVVDDDSASIDVGTLEEWEEGEYRWIHVAGNEDGDQLETNTGTIDLYDEIDVNFDVEITNVDDDGVVEGDGNVSVDANIENTGTTDGEQNVEFRVDGDVVDSETVALDADEETNVNFEYETEVGDAPGVVVTVASDDDSDSASAKILEQDPAEFDVTSYTEDVGTDEITLTAEIANTGDQPGTIDVQHAFNDEVDVNDSVSIDDGETKSISATFGLEDTRAGNFTDSAELEVADSTSGETLHTDSKSIEIDYGSIADAVDSATGGDTVSVGDGTFEENVVIEEAIRVRGVGDDITVANETGNEDPIFTLDSDNVVVRGLTFTDASTAIDVATDANDTQIRSNDFVADGMDPVINVAGDGTLIRNNVVEAESEPAETAIDLTGEPGQDGTTIIYNTIVTDPDEDGDDGTAVAIHSENSNESVVQTSNFHAGSDDNLGVVGTNDIDVALAEGPGSLSDFTADGVYQPEGALNINSGINEQNTSTEPNDPAEYVIQSVDVDPQTVLKGETITVSATVENEGDMGGEEIITLEVDGTSVNATEDEVELDPGEDTTVSLEYETTDAGDFDAAMVSETDPDGLSTGFTVQEPAYFEVTDFELDDDEIYKGETATATATVENTGDLEDTQTIHLEVNGYSNATESDLYLAGGDSAEVELTTEELDDIGIHNVDIVSADDSDGGTLAVLDPGDSFYRVSIDEGATDDSVTEGNDLTVEATITNIGDDDGDEQTIEFLIDGTQKDTESVKLDEGASTGVTFTYETSGSDVGSLTATVASDDDDDSKSITVDEYTPPSGGGGSPAPPSDDDDDDVTDDEPVTDDDVPVTDDDEPVTDDEPVETDDDAPVTDDSTDDEPPETADDTIPGFGVTAMLVALLSIALIAIRQLN